ncbi:MAG: GvpL/GvpF family gas vesicle protein [Gemmatimonadaceae bacterium]
MPIHLYAFLVATADPPPVELAGVSGSRVSRLAAGDGSVSAWVSSVDAPRRPGLDDVRAHDAVVMAALASGTTPVPARWGQHFANANECVEYLGSHGGAITRALSRVSGMVEMGVQIELALPDTGLNASAAREKDATTGPCSVGARSGGGRAYLEALHANRERERFVRALGRDLALAITAVLADVARDSCTDGMESGTPPALSLAHLIARDAAAEDRYRLAVEPFRRDPAVHLLVVNGPHAPYHFAELDR